MRIALTPPASIQWDTTDVASPQRLRDADQAQTPRQRDEYQTGDVAP